MQYCKLMKSFLWIKIICIVLLVSQAYSIFAFDYSNINVISINKDSKEWVKKEDTWIEGSIIHANNFWTDYTLGEKNEIDYKPLISEVFDQLASEFKKIYASELNDTLVKLLVDRHSKIEIAKKIEHNREVFIKATLDSQTMLNSIKGYSVDTLDRIKSYKENHETCIVNNIICYADYLRFSSIQNSVIKEVIDTFKLKNIIGNNQKEFESARVELIKSIQEPINLIKTKLKIVIISECIACSDIALLDSHSIETLNKIIKENPLDEDDMDRLRDRLFYDNLLDVDDKDSFKDKFIDAFSEYTAKAIVNIIFQKKHSSIEKNKARRILERNKRRENARLKYSMQDTINEFIAHFQTALSKQLLIEGYSTPEYLKYSPESFNNETIYIHIKFNVKEKYENGKKANKLLVSVSAYGKVGSEPSTFLFTENLIERFTDTPRPASEIIASNTANAVLKNFHKTLLFYNY